MNIWDELPAPFFVLAPMDDVTDTVFRQVIADCAPPDLFFTEFVNVDALQSQGREATLRRLRLTPKEHPIIAQLWGLKTENFKKSAADVAALGFDGIDLNFGCPVKDVVQNGACSTLIKPENWGRAVEYIRACREGAPTLPLSVKTRLGFNDIDFGWHELLLKQKLNALTIHGRTRKQMSKVPADWDKIGEVAQLRTSLFPATKIIGNGDVLNRPQGEALAAKYRLDGIMVGRGIFQDPFLFAARSPWAEYSKEQKIDLYAKHVKLFAQTWGEPLPQPSSSGSKSPGFGQNPPGARRHTNGYASSPQASFASKPDNFALEERAEAETLADRKVRTLGKFCKIYINGFDGAKEWRENLMAATSVSDLLRRLGVE